jgi:NADPH-dependent 2,4-dienoyl-CoA reductase/sulfur reductase-like enzyme
MKDVKDKVSRRRFLKGAAVAAPAMAAASVLGAQKSSVQAPKWDKEADVVVIGTGFAGLSAAIAAKDAGAKVLILEKMPQKHEGGNSRVSGNMWWTPTNLPEALEYMEALCAGLTDKEAFRLWQRK